MAARQAKVTNSSSPPGSTMRQMASSARSRLRARTINMAGRVLFCRRLRQYAENPALRPGEANKMDNLTWRLLEGAARFTIVSWMLVAFVVGAWPIEEIVFRFLRS